jgi:hypothetical protein
MRADALYYRPPGSVTDLSTRSRHSAKIDRFLRSLAQLVVRMLDQDHGSTAFTDLEQLRMQVGTPARWHFFNRLRAASQPSFSSTSGNCWKPNTTVVCRTAGASPGVIAVNRSHSGCHAKGDMAAQVAVEQIRLGKLGWIPVCGSKIRDEVALRYLHAGDFYVAGRRRRPTDDDIDRLVKQAQ